MEQDLLVELRRAADDFASDLEFVEELAGPFFLSHETDALFTLTAQLKGYERSNLRIDINEEGSLIAVSGEKQVQETVIKGLKVYKKDTEIEKFKKVFRIPDGVIWDEVKAEFNEDDSTLKISIPKKAKGIRWTHIEEVEQEENEDLVKQGSRNLQILDAKIQKTDQNHHDVKDDENVVQEKEDLVEQGSRNLQTLDAKIQKTDQNHHDVKDDENVVQEKEDLVEQGSRNLQTLDAKIQKTDQNHHDVKDDENVVQEKEDLVEQGSRNLQTLDAKIQKTDQNHHDVKDDENVVQEKEDLVEQGSRNLQTLDAKIQKTDQNHHDVKDDENVVQGKEDRRTVDNNTVEESSQLEELDHDQEQEENVDQAFQETHRIDEKTEKEEPEASSVAKPAEEAREGRPDTDKPRARGKRCKMCAPIVAGSVVLAVSFVLFAAHTIRSRTQTRRRKD